MVKPIRFDESSDSEDLQVLFDRIAIDHLPVSAAPAQPAHESGSGDSLELEALFDSAAASVAQPPATPAMPTAASPGDDSGDDLEALFDATAAAARAASLPAPAPAPASADAADDLDALFDSIVAQRSESEDAPASAVSAAPAAPVEDDLEALFDRVAAQSAPSAPASVSAPPAAPSEDDLEALFDRIVAQSAPAAPPATPAATPAADADNEDLESLFDAESARCAQREQDGTFQRIGHITRQLHDALRELGLDKTLNAAKLSIPDARERLAYISRLTESAAGRVLTAVETASPLQDDLLKQTRSLAARWEGLFSNQLSVDQFKALASDSYAYFQAAPKSIETTSAQLQEIMMAQDFQDLTGQVITKVLDIATSLEAQLLQLLVETAPAEAPVKESLLNGPVVKAANADALANQAQVDSLLESLGF